MNNHTRKEMRDENIMNQSRFLILTISSLCIKKTLDFPITTLLKLLAKTSNGAIKSRAIKLAKQDKTFLIKQNYFVMICWQLSLDQEENLMLLN
jgi:hypothetical protein